MRLHALLGLQIHTPCGHLLQSNDSRVNIFLKKDGRGFHLKHASRRQETAGKHVKMWRCSKEGFDLRFHNIKSNAQARHEKSSLRCIKPSQSQEICAFILAQIRLSKTTVLFMPWVLTSHISAVQFPNCSLSRESKYTVWFLCSARQAKWWMSPMALVCICTMQHENRLQLFFTHERDYDHPEQSARSVARRS